MEKILVSACLLGTNCKYNGLNNYIPNILEDLKNFIIIPICPEVDGGLNTPRIPSEVKGKKVFNKDGKDNTKYFEQGAQLALDKALKNDCHYAILKSKSPSCGYHNIYDGSFTNTLVNDSGITARLLEQNGIKIFTELNYKELLDLKEK